MGKEQIDFLPDVPDEGVRERVKARWDGVAKPLDGLGRFETLIAQIGAITGTADIDIRKKAVLVMCGDNGIVEEGVSQSGQEVTALVAESMGKGQSSVCKMAKWIGADVLPVDVGICRAEPIPGVIDKKVTMGTENFLKKPAMTEAQALQAIGVGMEMAAFCREQGYGLLATGEMGIGNTTTSSAMAAAMTGCAVEEITGRGAGLDDSGLSRKRQVIARALERYGLAQGAAVGHVSGGGASGEERSVQSRFVREETLRVLCCVGGLDIAALAGVFLGAAKVHLPVVIDGVISAVAALAAERLVPGVSAYMLPSHRSKEPAANRILQELGLEPILDAHMALGEGTGAVMFMGMLDMAMTLYDSPTTFSDISVEQYQRF